MDPFSEKKFNILPRDSLVTESLSAAAAGMHPVTNLDERCISFTIHMMDASAHSYLMRKLFETTEAFFNNLGYKCQSPSHSGLASFIDVNGSKFTGADRDVTKVHCHGFILIPYHVSVKNVESLISQLTIAALGFTYCEHPVVKSAANSLQITRFDRNRPNSNLANWIGYAQKEAVRSKASGEIGVFLPFDIRHGYGFKIASQLVSKRDSLLDILRGSDHFKIFRNPKPSVLPGSTSNGRVATTRKISSSVFCVNSIDKQKSHTKVSGGTKLDSREPILGSRAEERQVSYGETGSERMANKEQNEGLIDGLTRNAIASLRMGVEDYESEDADRQLSAVRNFSAGTLLLGKACLLNAAPPDANPMVVLGQKLTIGLEDGELVTKIVGHATLDVTQLKQRFKDFGLPAPRGNLDRLTTLRNAIEHLHTDQGPQQVKEAIAACFPTVLGFFELLGRSPLEDLAGAWKTMEALEGFQTQEAARCAQSYSAINWPEGFPVEPECPKCHSALVIQKNSINTDPVTMELRCLSCGTEVDSYRAVAVLVNGAFGKAMRRAAYDGEPGPICDCPECGHSLYISTGELNVCLYCQHEVSGECSVCGEALDPTNVDWDNQKLCSYHAHRAYKERDR